jgi:hypothetical protein
MQEDLEGVPAQASKKSLGMLVFDAREILPSA